MNPPMDDLTRRLVEVLEQVLQETVDAPTYPDGPCLDADTRKSIRALIREAESRGDGWIKVTERLPELETETCSIDLSFMDEDEAVYPGYMQFGESKEDISWLSYAHRAFIDRITHWRPLPTPPGGQ